MADNVRIPTSGTGDVNPDIAADDVGGIKHQRVKVEWGADGVATDTSAANPLPVVQTGTLALPTGAATDATNAANGVLVGAVTETAPGTDTASSGLNGRLQRIAQRLTSLIALLPGSLGQKTSAASLAVVVASDQSAVPVSGTVTANAGTGTLAVSLASVPSHAVTNAGTFATQDSQKVADNAAFTDGTTPVQPAGYVFDEVAGTALTENDAAAARIDSKRAQVGVIEDATTRGQRAAVSAAGAVKVDGSAVTQPVSGTVTTTPPANASTNVAQVAGTTADTNSGNKSAGTLRVTLATDQVQLTNALKVDGSAVTQPVSGTVTTTPPSNASSNVAQINGVTPLMGAGNTGTGSLRVTVATDQVAIPAAPAHATAVAQTAVACSASSVTLLSANTAAKQRTIVNDSSSIGYLRFNASAATNANYSIKMQPGQTYEFSPVLYDGEIRAISDTATGNWRISEWT